MRAFGELFVALACMVVLPALADAPRDQKKAAQAGQGARVQKGEASYYGPEFYGKEMSSGEPMKPDSNNAASKTLPLGTTAEVTNLDNGKRDVVVIEDRGPYVSGRIIDVSPKTAKRLGFKRDGVAPVKVKPLDVPPKDSGKNASEAATAPAADHKARPTPKRRRPAANSRNDH